MILYNITLAVDESIHDQWLIWMTKEHIPEILATEKFVDFKMYKVLLEKENNLTYSLQFFAESLAQVQLYLAQHAPALQAKSRAMFADQVVAFRTVLEEL